jgi:hypothetical protein
MFPGRCHESQTESTHLSVDHAPMIAPGFLHCVCAGKGLSHGSWKCEKAQDLLQRRRCMRRRIFLIYSASDRTGAFRENDRAVDGEQFADLKPLDERAVAVARITVGGCAPRQRRRLPRWRSSRPMPANAEARFGEHSCLNVPAVKRARGCTFACPECSSSRRCP